MFERGGLVTYSYDYIFQYVETSTALLAATPSTSPQPFSMATTSGDTTQSCFAIGPYNSEVIQDGIKKATLTLERSLAAEADRMYLGFEYQASPVTSDYV